MKATNIYLVFSFTYLKLDTVDHNILLKKLKMNDTVGMHLKWFENYLTNKKQYIRINQEDKTSLEIVKFGVPQGSILVSLLVLLYANTIQFVLDLLDPITFADDTNPFYSSKDVNVLFLTVNNDLKNFNQWFIANKLSPNMTKTKNSFFHKSSKKTIFL